MFSDTSARFRGRGELSDWDLWRLMSVMQSCLERSSELGSSDLTWADLKQQLWLFHQDDETNGDIKPILDHIGIQWDIMGYHGI